MFFFYKALLEPFRKEAGKSKEIESKKRKEREDAEKRRQEAIKKKREEEQPGISELTDEQAEILQKELDEKK